MFKEWFWRSVLVVVLLVVAVLLIVIANPEAWAEGEFMKPPQFADYCYHVKVFEGLSREERMNLWSADYVAWMIDEEWREKCFLEDARKLGWR